MIRKIRKILIVWSLYMRLRKINVANSTEIIKQRNMLQLLTSYLVKAKAQSAAEMKDSCTLYRITKQRCNNNFSDNTSNNVTTPPVRNNTSNNSSILSDSSKLLMTPAKQLVQWKLVQVFTTKRYRNSPSKRRSH